jgi:lycopene cyclase domain-containing protein
MDKHLSYLVINLLTIFFPVVLSFDERVQFYKKWQYLIPALLITGIVFLFWDYLFTIYQVWAFNDDYVIGHYFLDLPLEEILFFITVPFACVFIYECLNYYLKKDLLNNISSLISALLVVLSIAMLVLFPDKVYTVITFGLLLVLVVYAHYIKKAKYLSRFYLAYLVSLIPFYLVNGILTSIPIVIYNNEENMAIRVGTIPFEDHFYSLSLLLMNVLFYEYFKKRSSIRD